MLILVLANSTGRQNKCFNSRSCIYAMPAKARSWGGKGDVLMMTASYKWLKDSVCLTNAAESPFYLCCFGQTFYPDKTWDCSRVLPCWLPCSRCVRAVWGSQQEMQEQPIHSKEQWHCAIPSDSRRHCNITKKCSLHDVWGASVSRILAGHIWGSFFPPTSIHWSQ